MEYTEGEIKKKMQMLAHSQETKTQVLFRVCEYFTTFLPFNLGKAFTLDLNTEEDKNLLRLPPW